MMMDKISALLPKVLQKRGLKDEVDASHIVHITNAWLKENGAPEDATATKYQNRVLMIEVSTPVSAQECHGLSNDLLQILRTKHTALPPERILILRKADSVVE